MTIALRRHHESRIKAKTRRTMVFWWRGMARYYGAASIKELQDSALDAGAVGRQAAVHCRGCNCALHTERIDNAKQLRQRELERENLAL